MRIYFLCWMKRNFQKSRNLEFIRYAMPEYNKSYYLEMDKLHTPMSRKAPDNIITILLFYIAFIIFKTINARNIKICSANII